MSQTMSSKMTKIRSVLNALRPMLVTSFIAGVVLTILAPFGTRGFSFGGRFTYWVGLCLAGGFGAMMMEIQILRFKHKAWLFSGQPWPIALWQSIGATLSVALFSFAIFTPVGLADIALSLFYIWVIAMVICSFAALQKQGIIATNTQTRPKLYDRIKPKLRSARLYALSAEDHYVRAHTSAGDDLILMRLSDAIDEIAPLTGLSPHRSWWVAEQGVKTVKRSKGKTQIILHSEVSVPVSRNKVKIVKDAGWS